MKKRSLFIPIKWFEHKEVNKILLTTLIEITPNDEYNTEFLKLSVVKKKKNLNMLTLKKASLAQLLLHLKINLEKKQHIALINVPW